MKRYLFYMTLCFLPLLVQANHSTDNVQMGEIMGLITDESSGEPLSYVTVFIKNEAYSYNALSDEEGFYRIPFVAAGYYQVEAYILSHQKIRIESVKINEGQWLVLDIQLMTASYDIPDVKITAYRDPLIDIVQPYLPKKIDAEEIRNLPSRNINDAIATRPGVFQNDDGRIQVRGSRLGASYYMIDGVRSKTARGVPFSAIETVAIYSNGLPAKYGDTTGGVIVIETKSAMSP